MQNGKASLTRDTMAYGAAMAVDRAIGVALLPLLTAKMDHSTFGAWTQVLTSFALLSNILELGFFHSLSQYIPGAKRGRVRRILNGILLIVLANGTIFVAFCSAFPKPLSDLIFGDPGKMNAIYAGSVFIVSECLFEILILGFLRSDNRVTLCSFYYAAKSVLRLLLLWEGLLSGLDLAGLLWRLSTSNLLLLVAVYFVHVLPTLRGFTGTKLGGFWKSAFMHSGAIMVSSNLAWANASLSRFFVVHMLGLSSLGLYAANYSLASMVSLSSLVINFTTIPHINAAWNSGNANRAVWILNSAIEYYLFISIPMGVALGLFYEPIANLLIRGDFYPEPTLMWTLIVAVLLMGVEQLLSFATFMGSSRFSVASRAAGLVVNVVIAFFYLVPVGLSAIALAASAASLLVIAASTIYLKSLCGFVFPWRSAVWLCAAGAAMMLVSFTTRYLLHWPTLFGATLSGLIGLLSFLLVECLRENSVSKQIFRRSNLRKCIMP